VVQYTRTYTNIIILKIDCTLELIITMWTRIFYAFKMHAIEWNFMVLGHSSHSIFIEMDLVFTIYVPTVCYNMQFQMIQCYKKILRLNVICRAIFLLVFDFICPKMAENFKMATTSYTGHSYTKAYTIDWKIEMDWYFTEWLDWIIINIIDQF
jgi:hypothetical protein